MKIKYITTGLVLLFAINAYSQNKDLNNITSLEVGDTMPKITIPKILQHNKITSAKIEEYKDQLLILDFWDTYCRSCILAMPKMQSIQQKFGNKVKILLVNWQSPEIVRQFFNTNNFVKNHKINLPTVVDDKILRQYFKHQSVPHEVWIYKGKIRGITREEYVTEDNINSILEGKDVKWQVKKELTDFDYRSPLLSLRKNVNNSTNFLRYSALTGYLEGVERKSGNTKDTVSKTIREYIINASIISAYYYGFSKISQNPFSTAQNRVVLEVKDVGRYFFNKAEGYRDAWEQQNYICYESRMPDSLTSAKKGALIVSDLNRLLGLNGRLEKRLIKCLALVKDTTKRSNPEAIKSKKSVDVRSAYSIKSLIQNIETKNRRENKYPFIVDKTDYSGVIELYDWNSIEDLTSQLNMAGFLLHETEQEIEVFVLSES